MTDNTLMGELKQLICMSIKVGQLFPNRSIEDLYAVVVRETKKSLEKINANGKSDI